MANILLYQGPSGCGKSSAMRNLPGAETFVIKPNAKALAIPGWRKKFSKCVVNLVPDTANNLPATLSPEGNMISTDKLTAIGTLFQLISAQREEIKYIILEDFSHYYSARIFSDEFMGQTSGNAAFQRWNVFGADVYNALFNGIENLRSDLQIIIIHHTELKEDGTYGFKTAGKLLDNTIDPPSYFTYVLHGLIEAGEGRPKYLIQTNRDSIRQAKTPFGVFNLETEFKLPNDIVPILERIKAYENGEIEIKY